MGGEGKNPYRDAGVDYDPLDRFKRHAQAVAKQTEEKSLIEELGGKCLGWTRGESVFGVETISGAYLGHVEEGLGTKNLVADAMEKLTGKTYYDTIAQDTVAMIVNDLITLGFLPTTIAMHLAVGSSDWFNNKARCDALIRGWASSCRTARCVWVGGETPTLKDIILPEASLLSGSATGMVMEHNLLRHEKIKDGDKIIFLKSNGIHANGLTLARKIALELSEDPKKLDGYLKTLPDGSIYGEELLRPTPIYVPVIDEIYRFGQKIHYAVNITGHGWRKLMRAPIEATYIIEKVPEAQPIFTFLQAHGLMNPYQAYGTFNMGAGFALYVAPEDAELIVGLARTAGVDAYVAGYISMPSTRSVFIKPYGMEFAGDTLNIR